MVSRESPQIRVCRRGNFRSITRLATRVDLRSPRSNDTTAAWGQDSSSAQADSRPWLEIFADDVRANHGSATGRLDEDALFYLRSRGIPLDQARQVLTRAFANTIVEQLHPASLRTHVAGWFDEEDET